MKNDKRNNKPTHRISFYRIVGKDENGRDILGAAREIAAVWPRRGGGSAIIRFDHIPVELTKHEGVLFMSEVPAAAEDRGFA